MLGLVVLLLASVGFYVLGPGAAPPESRAINPVDDPNFYSIDLDELETTSVIPNVAGREAGEKPVQDSSAAKSGSPSTSSSPSGASRSTRGSASNGATSREPPAEDLPPAESENREPSTTFSRSSGSTAGGGVSVRRRASGGVALSEPSEIAAMVREAMSKYSDQFVQCHTKKLNQDEDFGGVWELSLVVNTDGSASHVLVRAKDGTAEDAEFEACMVSKVEKWRFKTTTEAMGFRKRYTFGR